MPNSQSHGTDNNQTIRDCKRVIDWLNASEDSAGRRRIRQLLRNVRIIKSNWTLVEDGDGGALKYRGPIDQYRRAELEILGLLGRYRFCTYLFSFGGRIITRWAPVSGPDGRFKRSWPPIDGKFDDVQAVYELTSGNARTIERVAECSCGKWFFVKFEHHKFCSSKCRDKANKSTPESREYRRNKAREYYWLHKNKNVK